MRHIKTIGLMFLGTLLAACGGGSTDGLIALNIENSRAPAGVTIPAVQAGATPVALSRVTLPELTQAQALQVNEFKVTVTGADLTTPIVVTAPATASQIEVMSIPKGEGRSFLIEAFNAAGDVIRRRQIDGVLIKGGVTTSMKVSLNTIPQILNLQNDAVVMAHHFKLIGFGEPGTSLSLNASSAGQSVSLNPSISGNTQVISPSMSDGLFELTPVSFPLGRQTLTVRDEATGESSSIEVTVLERSRPGRKTLTLGQVGPSFAVGSGLGTAPDVNFPLVVETLANSQKSEEAADTTTPAEETAP